MNPRTRIGASVGSRTESACEAAEELSVVDEELEDVKQCKFESRGHDFPFVFSWTVDGLTTVGLHRCSSRV